MQRPSRVPRRVLVVAPNWIGDALMALPLLAEIKACAADCHLTLFAPAAVAELLASSPLIDSTITSPWPHGGLQLFARLGMARRLRRQAFDTAVVLPNSLKAALIPAFAGIAQRVGYLGESRRLLLTGWLPNANRSISMVQRYLALLELLGLPRSSIRPAIAKSAALQVAPHQIAAVQARFDIDPARPLVVFCPGAEYGPAKRWPAPHFARLADMLAARDASVQLVLAGARGDVKSCEEIVAAAKTKILNLAGATSIFEVSALLAGASLVVSNDSGLMHVAASLERPVVALYGSTDPRHTPPGSDSARVLWLHLSCSPCFQRVCPLGHLRCLVDMTPESVFAAIPSGALH